MAHWAKIKNNIVMNVIVSDSDYANNYDGIKWIQTSYNTFANQHNNGNTPLRYNYASVGGTYDSDNDAFINPKPFSNWVLDSDFNWVAPVPKPAPTGYEWNDSDNQWEAKDIYAN